MITSYYLWEILINLLYVFSLDVVVKVPCYFQMAQYLLIFYAVNYHILYICIHINEKKKNFSCSLVMSNLAYQ